MRSSFLAPVLMPAVLFSGGLLSSAATLCAQEETPDAPAKLVIGPGGPTLEQILEIAKRRAAAQRAEVEAKLTPFLADLRLDYKGSREILAKRFALIAEIGPSVIPVLIDNLAPEQPIDGGKRNIARNSARVLRQMDLSQHRPALIDLLESENKVGRHLAIPLCGQAGGVECAQAILRVFPSLSDIDDLVNAIDADRAIGSYLLKQTARTMLNHSAEEMRSAALRHVIATGDPAAVPDLIAALADERGRQQLSLHVEAFTKLAPRNGDAAEALLPLLQPGDRQLDQTRREKLATAIGSIAPSGDKDVARTLDEMIASENDFEVALAAAKGLEALGDRRAEKKIVERAENTLRRDSRDARAFENLADAFSAFDDTRKALSAYERALRYGSQNSLIRRRVNLKIAHLHAGLENSSGFLKALEAAGLGRADIEREAEGDEAFAKMLEKDRVQRFLRQLPR